MVCSGQEGTSRRGYLKVAAAACLWGTWSLFFKPAERLHTVAPAVEAFIVFSVILVAVAPNAWRDRPARRRNARAWAGMIWLGVGDALNALLFFWAMQRASLAVAVLSHYLAPVLIAALSPLVLRERTRRETWIALVVALGGLLLLLEPWRAEARGALPGALLGAGSAVFYAANILVTKRIQVAFSSRELLAWHMPFALIVLFAFVPAGGFAIGVASWAWILGASLLAGALAGVLFLDGLVRVRASRAAVLTLLEPLVAVLIGGLVWGQRLSAVAILGAALVLAGAYAALSIGRDTAVERA
jgi:drug/metabolite transporter (DMT)-like permease